MPRPTMANLISFVGKKIGDPSNAIMSADDVQAALDATRYDVQNEILQPVYSYVNGVLVWLDHYSNYGFWEDGETLLSLSLTTLTPISDPTEKLREPDAEGKGAHWQFADSQIAVRAYGHSYDVYRVAADLLEQMIALQAPNTINFSASGQQFSLNQITQTRLQLVQSYRAKQRISAIATRRSDTMRRADWEKIQRVGIVSAGVPFIDGRE